MPLFDNDADVASGTASQKVDSADLLDSFASTLEDAMQKATGPSYNQDTDSQEALREVLDTIAGDVVNLDGDAIPQKEFGPAAIGRAVTHLLYVSPEGSGADARTRPSCRS